MQSHQKKFKCPPKKFHPPGLSILHEDHDIIVVNKIGGLLTMGTDKEKEKTAYFLLTNYVKKGNPKSNKRIFIVHRLDRDTSGVLVFAKTEKAKRFLQDEWQEYTKTYYAVVHGVLAEKEGVITSYMAEASTHKMYTVTNSQKGKFAKTAYKVVGETNKYSLLEIELFTGRKNQIRLHLAEDGYPIAGDKIYGIKDKGIKRLTLHATTLTIAHPHTKELMRFEAKVPDYFTELVKS